MRFRTLKNLSLLSLIPTMLALLALTLSALPVSAAGYFYDFESTLSPWQAKGDSGVNVIFSRESGDSGPHCLAPGNGYAQLANGNNVGPGQGMWMYAKFPVSGPGTVTVKWDARDKGGDCNGGCYAMAYIGASAPSSSGSFTSVGVITDLWPSNPFGTSTYYVPPGPTNSVYVAVGWKAAINTIIQGAKVRHDCIAVEVP